MDVPFINKSKQKPSSRQPSDVQSVRMPSLPQAFKAHDVDLPEGNTQAPEQMITLPEILDFEELELLSTERFSLE